MEKQPGMRRLTDHGAVIAAYEVDS